MVDEEGQAGSKIRVVFTTGAGSSIMGKKSPTTEKVHISRKCTYAEVKQLEAFREKQPNPAGNPIQWNELGSVANWRVREENTFALLEEQASGKTNPQAGAELACAHIPVLPSRPSQPMGSHFLGYIFMYPLQLYSGFSLESDGM